ncbi:hypothetical protein COU59_00820 [Candidatus Pacearchaeota archaeon CG10_big_fil_rev_8_21_14_0_10_34_12]|nr:MAG: hypothetical protein COU59_00820 [Candidatus Pacearchaeota archaeon CG10_big_fil_rev_8_21_14_0_10_34_12]
MCKDCELNPDPVNCKPNQGCHWWYFTSTLSETGNITGITVDSRQKCYDFAVAQDSCDPVKIDTTEKFGTNYINPNGSITWENNWIYVYESQFPTTLTETFNGTDDNSNAVSDSYTFNLTA